MTELLGIIEAHSYLAVARRLMSEAEREAVVDMVAADPEAGTVVKGTGGLRKARIPLQGRGKRGGGRVIYWFHSSDHPAVLLWAFAKNASDDLSMTQYRKLASAMDRLIEEVGGSR